MTKIILHSISNISVGIDSKNGFVNATSLCAAYNVTIGKSQKFPANWLALKSSREYIAYVSSAIGIPIAALVEVKVGGLGEQGTWVHPDLADAFAMWLSPEYKYHVSKWLQDWRSQKDSLQYPNQITGQLVSNPKAELIETVNIIFDGLFSKIPDEIRTGMKIEAMCNVDPSLRSMLEPFKPKLLLEAELLSPTAIGKLIEERTGQKHSGQAINKMLVAKNLQKSTGLAKGLQWEAIGQGVEFSQVIADTAAGHGKTVQSLRWYASVVDLLLGA
jgi:hypothetical protein